jgi:hypothetical protein
MRKSYKAYICHHLEAEVSCVHSMEPYDRTCTILILDVWL